jgi:hypothetical protein
VVVTGRWATGRGTRRCAPAMGSHTSAMAGDPGRRWWWRRGKPWWCCWRCCHRGFYHCRCSCRHYRRCSGCCSYAGCCCCRYRCRGRCRCSCQAGEVASKAATVEQTMFCWSRTPSEQQLDRRCPGGFPPSWYLPGCGGWRRWCRRTTKKRSRSP